MRFLLEVMNCFLNKDFQILISMFKIGKTRNVFFQQVTKSVLPFDIFAASFYLLSRYEEYLPHVKDDYGRFTASESIAYKNKFLHQPVVDIWAYKLKDVLLERFENFRFPKRHYKIQPVLIFRELFILERKD